MQVHRFSRNKVFRKLLYKLIHKFILYLIQQITIFMSSHIFEEIEEVCDSVAMIKDGKIIDILDLYQLRHWDMNTYHITFQNSEDTTAFVNRWRKSENISYDNNICTKLPKNKLNPLLKDLRQYPISSLYEEHLTLEQYFLDVYKNGGLANGSTSALDSSFIWKLGVLINIAIIFYTLGAIKFQKKDLPL